MALADSRQCLTAINSAIQDNVGNLTALRIMLWAPVIGSSRVAFVLYPADLRAHQYDTRSVLSQESRSYPRVGEKLTKNKNLPDLAVPVGALEEVRKSAAGLPGTNLGEDGKFKLLLWWLSGLHPDMTRSWIQGSLLNTCPGSGIHRAGLLVPSDG